MPGMKAIIDALNVAYDEEERRSFIRLNLISMAMTLGAIAAGLIGIGADRGLPDRTLLSRHRVRPPRPSSACCAGPLLFAALLVGLAVLYRFGPNRREAKWQWLTVGSVFAAIAWLAGSSLLSFYLSQFANYNATYGSLAAGIGLMMWMWMSAIVILLGAELNAEIEHQTARDTTVGSRSSPRAAWRGGCRYRRRGPGLTGPAGQACRAPRFGDLRKGFGQHAGLLRAHDRVLAGDDETGHAGDADLVGVLDIRLDRGAIHVGGELLGYPGRIEADSSAASTRTLGIADVAALGEIGHEQSLDDLACASSASAQRTSRWASTVFGERVMRSKWKSMPSIRPRSASWSCMGATASRLPNLSSR